MSNPEHRLIHSGSLTQLENRLFRIIRNEKRTDPFSPVMVLSGSRFLGHCLGRELARRGVAHTAVRYVTFNELAEALAGDALEQRVPVPDGGKGLIVRGLVGKLGANSYFHDVQNQPHLPEVLAASFTDVEDSRTDLGHPQRSGLQVETSKKIGEVAGLYAQYRAALACGGMYTEADLLAAAAHGAAHFSDKFGVTRMLVYGFYELTEAQRELLSALSKRVSLTLLLVSGESGRFATAHKLRDWFAKLPATVESLDYEEATTDLIAVRSQVFEGAKQFRKTDGSFRVISCPEEAGEAREIAREAVRLKRDEGIQFHEMAVLARDGDRYLPLLAQVFEQVGLPFYLRAGLPLERTAVGRSVLALLGLPQNNYRRSDIAEWFMLGALADEHPFTLWDRLSREAGIVEGELQWRQKLAALAADYDERAEAPEDEVRKRGMKFYAEQTRKFLGFVADIMSAGEAWKNETSWKKLAASVIEWLRKLHASSQVRDQIEDAVRGLEELDRAGPCSLAEFARILKSVLKERSERRGTLERTGVHLLALSAARHARFRVVFVPGMTERSFPLAGRDDPILLDSERSCISENLPKKRSRPQEEKLLFLLALEAAREKAVLTFPRREAATGAERIPSYYVLKALETVHGEPVSYKTLAAGGGLVRVEHVPDSRLLSLEGATAIDAREFDLGRMRVLLGSAKPQTARYLERKSSNFARALHAEQTQWGSHSLTEYDGLLASQECHRLLEEMYSERRVYSASELQQYAACPYHYFLGQVLRLKPLEEPETIEELDALEKGEMVHRILREFFERMKDAGLLPLSVRHRDGYRAALGEICERNFREIEQRGSTGYPVSWQLNRKFLLQDLERYVLEEAERESEWLPELFEVSFGMGGGPDFELETKVGRIRLRGRLDRVDRSTDAERVRVVDYKSGKYRGNQKVDLDKGRLLQLPIYLLATGVLIPKRELQTSLAQYEYLTRKGEHRTCKLEGGVLAEKVELLKDVLAAIVGGCRNGVFPRCPDHDSHSGTHCGQCEFRSIGDPRHMPLWDMKKNDSCLDPYRRIREAK